MTDEADFRPFPVTLVKLEVEAAIDPPRVLQLPVHFARRQLDDDAFVEEVGGTSTLQLAFPGANVELLDGAGRRRQDGEEEEEEEQRRRRRRSKRRKTSFGDIGHIDVSFR